MNLKTITAGTMAQALALVKRELGADAVILHTRRYKQGGIWGFGGHMVVEITAADAKTLGQQRKRTTAARRAEASAVSQSDRPSPSPQPAPARSVLSSDTTAGDLIRRTYALAKADLARLPQDDRSQHAGSPQMGAAAGQLQSQYTGGSASDLAQEMQAVKRMVATMMRQQQARPTPDLPDKLFDQYLSLLKQEVTEEMAQEVVNHVQSTLDKDELEDGEKVRKAVAAAVASLIPTDGEAGQLPPRGDDHRPRTIALIGPTGVGKTTTIAKLAATFKLKQKKKVGLITLDTYRIAAVDQLRTYAGIIGVPLHVASSPEELVAALNKLRDCDVVLLDTAGRSQRNDPQLQQLRTFIQVANPHEVHLVLSSTCAQSVLMEAAERFSSIRVDRIIFTKLDEAVSFGVLLNVARKVNKRLSYVTTGQEVPHQIEPGTPGRLAALVLGQEV